MKQQGKGRRSKNWSCRKEKNGPEVLSRFSDLDLSLVHRMLLLSSTERMCHQTRPQRDQAVLTARSCPSDECRLLARNERMLQGVSTGNVADRVELCLWIQMARPMRDDLLRGDNVEDHREQPDSVDDRESAQCCVYRLCRLSYRFHAFGRSRSFLWNWRSQTRARAGEGENRREQSERADSGKQCFVMREAMREHYSCVACTESHFALYPSR